MKILRLFDSTWNKFSSLNLWKSRVLYRVNAKTKPNFVHLNQWTPRLLETQNAGRREGQKFQKVFSNTDIRG